MIDGEAVLLGVDGRSDFKGLHSRRYDETKMGYSDGGPYKFDTKSPGNSNAGHDYGNAQFTDTDRWALVEYLKAVGGRRVGDKIVP